MVGNEVRVMFGVGMQGYQYRQRLRIREGLSTSVPLERAEKRSLTVNREKNRNFCCCGGMISSLPIGSQDPTQRPCRSDHPTS
jgi:hypothetical protein